VLSAWVDESGSNAAVDPGTYILSAVVAFDHDLDRVRDAMQRIKPKTAKKVHWHDDDDDRHHLVIDTIAALPIEAVVVIRTALGDRAEHSRRKCLDALLRELHGLGCPQVTLESRGRADDSRDREMLQFLRRSHTPAGAIRMDHQVGPKEPMLWIPDAVCGAITRHRTGDRVFFERIQARTQVIDMR
jgi:hypothetical protein